MHRVGVGEAALGASDRSVVYIGTGWSTSLFAEAVLCCLSDREFSAFTSFVYRAFNACSDVDMQLVVTSNWVAAISRCHEHPVRCFFPVITIPAAAFEQTVRVKNDSRNLRPRMGTRFLHPGV